MSKYTTLVRWICENAYNLDDFKETPKTIDNIVKSGSKVIFCERVEDEPHSFIWVPQFEIYSASHFYPLCGKILRHYYFNEIGFETVEQWKLFLINKMREIMPYYNKLYESNELEFNPFDDVNYRRTGIKNEEGNSDRIRFRSDERNSVDGTSENNKLSEEDSVNSNRLIVNERKAKNTDSGENLFSDTPQNGLSDVRNGDYLTNATTTANEQNQESNDVNNEENNSNRKRENEIKTERQNYGNQKIDENETENNKHDNSSLWDEEVKGKMSSESYSKRLIEYRNTIINIDNMIIDDLKDLFMLLW